MKKSAFIFASAIVAAMVCVFTGCSDNGDYVKMSWKPNEKVIEALRTTTTPIVFKSTGQTKDFDRVEGDKWEENIIPPEMWTVILVQIRGYGPKRIVFKDGKAYCTPWTYYGYKCFEEENDSKVVKTIERLWGCHENKIQHWQNFYFEFDFNYNKSKKTFVFGDVEYGVMSCETNEMSLSSLGDDRRTVGYYEADLTDNENELFVFNNYTEITQYKLSQLREIYGNTFTDEYYNNLAPSQSWSQDYDLVELEQKFNEEIAGNNKVQ